jgi:hypothetical protein
MENYTDQSRFTKFEPVYVNHKGKTLKDITTVKSYEMFLVNLDNVQYRIATIPKEVENRPDLLSFLAYGTSGYWWLLILFNGILDPYTELTADKEIKIPIL